MQSWTWIAPNMTTKQVGKPLPSFQGVSGCFSTVGLTNLVLRTQDSPSHASQSYGPLSAFSNQSWPGGPCNFATSLSLSTARFGSHNTHRAFEISRSLGVHTRGHVRRGGVESSEWSSSGTPTTSMESAPRHETPGILFFLFITPG